MDIMMGPTKATTPGEYKVIGGCSFFLLVGAGVVGLVMSWRASAKPELAEAAAKLRFGSISVLVIAAAILIAWYIANKFFK